VRNVVARAVFLYPIVVIFGCLRADTNEALPKAPLGRYKRVPIPPRNLSRLVNGGQLHRARSERVTVTSGPLGFTGQTR
jgi:hypothetical protein